MQKWLNRLLVHGINAPIFFVKSIAIAAATRKAGTIDVEHAINSGDAHKF